MSRASSGRHGLVLLAAALAMSACSSPSGGHATTPRRVTTSAVSPSEHRFTMPSACALATAHKRSLLKGRTLRIKSHSSSTDLDDCTAFTSLQGEDRSTSFVTVSATPNASIAAGSISSGISSGRCKAIDGVRESACTSMDNQIVHVQVARGNINILASFRLAGLVHAPLQVSEYVRSYAQTLLQSIR